MVGPTGTLQALVLRLDEHGDAPAVLAVRPGEVAALTYRDLHAQALGLAAGLLNGVIGPGETVGVFGPNVPELIVVRLALLAAGAVAAPIDDLATDAEAETFLRDSGCRVAFASHDHADLVRRVLGPEGRTILIDGEGGEHWRTLLRQPGALPERAPEDPAVLVYTSGTTGNPKAFHLSHVNILANIEAVRPEGLIGPGDRLLVPLPLYHIYPFVMGMLLPLSCGAAVVLPAAATGPEIVDALRRAEVTAMIGVPRLYLGLLQGIEARVAGHGRVAGTLFKAMLAASTQAKRRLGVSAGRQLFGSLHKQLAPKLRLMASGGAKLEGEAIERLEALGWAVYSGYGLAETASIFTGNLPGRKRLGSEGRPLSGGQLRIAEPNAEGTGEIQLMGASVFGGYRNNPTANAGVFTEDGWFRTGDLGHVDGEGYVFVTGRLKELIVLGGGKNVYPEEVEKHYAAHPSLREVAVLEQKGALVALVVPDLAAIGEGANRRLDDVVRVALADRSRDLPSFERIAGYAITREPLPRTRLGKIRRHLLPGLYEQARSGRSAAPTELSAEDKALLARPRAAAIWSLLQARFPQHRLTPDTSAQLDLGIDSLEWMTLAVELEQRVGVRLTEEEIAGIDTLRDLLRAAEEASEAPVGEATGTLSAEQAAWLERAGAGHRVLGTGLYGVNRLLMLLGFRLRVLGLENLPASGPYIVAANHVSDLDPLVVAAALPYGRMRRSWWGGDVGRLFGSKAGRALARAANIFPVDERAPGATLDMALAVLGRGEALTWFPESWRSPDGELQRFLPGIGVLAQKSGVPIVPARIAGAFEAMPRTARLPRLRPIRIIFAPPRTAEELAAAGEGDSEATRIADGLRKAVAAISP